jgi:hypothetical protein
VPLAFVETPPPFFCSKDRIVLTESNRFVWPGPDVRPVDSESGYHALLPPALFEEVSVGLSSSPEASVTKPRFAAIEIQEYVPVECTYKIPYI